MYVLVDMEWISNQHGNHWPTQLAAARVDAQWNTVDTFSVLFRPRDFSLQQWGQRLPFRCREKQHYGTLAARAGILGK